MNTRARALVVFTRSPRAEALAKGFRADRGAPLFRALLASWGELAAKAGVALVVSAPAEGLGEIVRSGAAPGAVLQEQRGGSFGERLADAVAQAGKAGFESLVVSGGDSAAIPASDLARAFEAAEDGGIAVGPASDGGMYLIGLLAESGPMLRSISPRSSREAARFLAAVAASGSRTLLLDPRDEIDSVPDARRLCRRSLRLPDWRPFHDLLAGALPAERREEAVEIDRTDSPFGFTLPPRAPPLSAS